MDHACFPFLRFRSFLCLLSSSLSLPWYSILFCVVPRPRLRLPGHPSQWPPPVLALLLLHDFVPSFLQISNSYPLRYDPFFHDNNGRTLRIP